MAMPEIQNQAAATLSRLQTQQLYLESVLKDTRNTKDNLQAKLINVEDSLTADPPPDRTTKKKLKQTRWRTKKTLEKCENEEMIYLNTLQVCQINIQQLSQLIVPSISAYTLPSQYSIQGLAPGIGMDSLSLQSQYHMAGPQTVWPYASPILPQCSPELATSYQQTRPAQELTFHDAPKDWQAISHAVSQNASRSISTSSGLSEGSSAVASFQIHRKDTNQSCDSKPSNIYVSKSSTTLSPAAPSFEPINYQSRECSSPHKLRGYHSVSPKTVLVQELDTTTVFQERRYSEAAVSLILHRMAQRAGSR